MCNYLHPKRLQYSAVGRIQITVSDYWTAFLVILFQITVLFSAVVRRRKSLVETVCCCILILCISYIQNSGRPSQCSTITGHLQKGFRVRPPLGGAYPNPTARLVWSTGGFRSGPSEKYPEISTWA